MPAMGPCAPARMFVAVARDRAGDTDAAEKTGRDIRGPLRHELAIGPMAAAVMLSATTADNSDSMEPRSAKLTAVGQHFADLRETERRQFR